MQAVKIVITGAYGAGKSSFIRSVSAIDVVDTEAHTTLDEERSLKKSTTVALDFGMISVSDEVVLYLFGTPGQERFDFMWEHLTIGCLGYVVLVDSARPETFPETRRLIDRFAQLTDAPFIVAANKQDSPAALPPAVVRIGLGLDPSVPVLGCMVQEKESVKEVLLQLLEDVFSRTVDDDVAV